MELIENLHLFFSCKFDRKLVCSLIVQIFKIEVSLSSTNILMRVSCLVKESEYQRNLHWRKIHHERHNITYKIITKILLCMI